MERVEATGRSVNEAIENALVRLGAGRDQVDVEVLHEGSRGILGIGAEDARVIVVLKGQPEPATAPRGMDAGQQADPQWATAPVRHPRTPRERGGSPSRRDRPTSSFEDDVVAPEDGSRPVGVARPPSGLDTLPRRPAQALNAELPDAAPTEEDAEDEDAAAAVASDELVEAAIGVIMELLELLRVEGEVEVRSRTYPLTLNIHGEDLGILIGRHGDTLASLQFMVNLVVSRRMGRWTRVVVDVEEYRLRRERTLRDVASRAAERVRRTRQNVTLEPMPSNERRIVHLALQGDRYVSTHSIGEGDSRKVVISPRGR